MFELPEDAGLEGYDYWVAAKQLIVPKNVAKYYSPRYNGWIDYDVLTIHYVDGEIAPPIEGLPSEFWNSEIKWVKDRGTHRIDGPAIIGIGGRIAFFLRNNQYAIDDWLRLTPLAEEKKVMLKIRWG